MRKTERGQDGGIDTMTNINFLFSQFKNGKREDQKEKTKKKNSAILSRNVQKIL
jgi:hypothetical protein